MMKLTYTLPPTLDLDKRQLNQRIKHYEYRTDEIEKMVNKIKWESGKAVLHKVSEFNLRTSLIDNLDIDNRNG